MTPQSQRERNEDMHAHLLIMLLQSPASGSGNDGAHFHPKASHIHWVIKTMHHGHSHIPTWSKQFLLKFSHKTTLGDCRCVKVMMSNHYRALNKFPQHFFPSLGVQFSDALILWSPLSIPKSSSTFPQFYLLWHLSITTIKHPLALAISSYVHAYLYKHLSTVIIF